MISISTTPLPNFLLKPQRPIQPLSMMTPPIVMMSNGKILPPPMEPLLTQTPLIQHNLVLPPQQQMLAPTTVTQTPTFLLPQQTPAENIYSPTQTTLSTYNMFMQPYKPLQHLQLHYGLHILNLNRLSRSIKSSFEKEPLKYEISNTTNVPHLKTYNGTTYPDNHIDTQE